MNITVSIKPITFEYDAQIVNDLLEALHKEQSSLVIADIDAIELIIDLKSMLLQKLNISAKNRYAALVTNGFEASEEGMLMWLKKNGTPTLNKSWRSFQKSLIEAKEMNRLNGLIISKHFNRNQQILNHLSGKSATGEFYGKNGQAQSLSHARTAFMA